MTTPEETASIIVEGLKRHGIHFRDHGDEIIALTFVRDAAEADRKAMQEYMTAPKDDNKPDYGRI